MTLSKYKTLLSQLPVWKKDTLIAPHKAILLLSVFDLIETGAVTTPFIPLSDNLERVFRLNWEKYIPSPSPFYCRMEYPFYHLSTSPFWKLEKLPTFEKHREYSMAALKRSFSGAKLSEDLFTTIVSDHNSLDELKRTLIDKYLNHKNEHNF